MLACALLVRLANGSLNKQNITHKQKKSAFLNKINKWRWLKLQPKR